MNSIMYALIALLAVSVSTLVVIYLRNRVLFRLGVRNIPRRRAQTTLIVLGLMLSTLIISAAFTTGDTVQRSIDFGDQLPLAVASPELDGPVGLG